MINWRIFYDDGATFDDSMGQPHEAPSTGFICAIGYDECGARYIMHGWDHYCWSKESSQWWGMDYMGVFDRLRRNLVYAYKEGRTVEKTRFAELMQAANIDPDFEVRKR